jgi:alkylhydroperoxidase/carboxymuconolactone decarboxylase family protein YurZ
MTTHTDEPVLDLIKEITIDSIERSELDPKALMLVRMAALVAVDAPPMSYVANLAVAEEVGLSPEEIQSALIAIMPIVGSPRVVAALGNIARGLGMVIEQLEEETS